MKVRELVKNYITNAILFACKKKYYYIKYDLFDYEVNLIDWDSNPQSPVPRRVCYPITLQLINKFKIFIIILNKYKNQDFVLACVYCKDYQLDLRIPCNLPDLAKSRNFIRDNLQKLRIARLLFVNRHLLCICIVFDIKANFELISKKKIIS